MRCNVLYLRVAWIRFLFTCSLDARVEFENDIFNFSFYFCKKKRVERVDKYASGQTKEGTVHSKCNGYKNRTPRFKCWSKMLGILNCAPRVPDFGNQLQYSVTNKRTNTLSKKKWTETL